MPTYTAKNTIYINAIYTILYKEKETRSIETEQ